MIFTSDKFAPRILLKVLTSSTDHSSSRSPVVISPPSSSEQAKQEHHDKKVTFTSDTTHHHVGKPAITITTSCIVDDVIVLTGSRSRNSSPLQEAESNISERFTLLDPSGEFDHHNDDDNNDESAENQKRLQQFFGQLTTNRTMKKDNANPNKTTNNNPTGLVNSLYSVPEMAYDGRNVCIVNFQYSPGAVVAAQKQQTQQTPSSSSSSHATSTPAATVTPPRSPSQQSLSTTIDKPTNSSSTNSTTSVPPLLSHSVCESLLNLRKKMSTTSEVNSANVGTPSSSFPLLNSTSSSAMILMSIIEIVTYGNNHHHHHQPASPIQPTSSGAQQTTERIFDLLHPVNSHAVYEATEKKLKMNPNASSTNTTTSNSAKNNDANNFTNNNASPSSMFIVENAAWREMPNSVEEFDELLKHLPSVPAVVASSSKQQQQQHASSNYKETSSLSSMRPTSSTTVIQFSFQRREPGRIFKSLISLVSVPFHHHSSVVGQETSSPAMFRKCLEQFVTSSSSSSTVSSSISYRQSALTQLLSDIFAGNCALNVVASVSTLASSGSLSISDTSLIKFLSSLKQSPHPIAFTAKSNSERAAAAVNEMKNEVEGLRRKLEEETRAREEERHERADEVAQLESRRKMLEHEQRAKKTLNAKALASISKQMKTLQQLQSQMTQKQSILKESNAVKQEKRSIADQQLELEQKRQRESEIALMREQEAILQRQIALQLEAQQAVQQKMREETEKSRADLLSREMSFVLRAAAHRTRDEAETVLLRNEVRELRDTVEDTRHEALCKRLRSSALSKHCREQQTQLAFLQERHLVMDTLLNDGVESRAKDIRDATKDLELTLEKIEQIKKEKENAEMEISKRLHVSADCEIAKQNRAEEDELAKLRAIRDEKRTNLNELSQFHDELLVQRSVVEDAAGKACRDVEIAAQKIREAELMNARRRQEESIYGEQLADALRTNVATTRRIHELDSLIASIQVKIRDIHGKRTTLDASRETFASFLSNQQHALALVEQTRKQKQQEQEQEQRRENRLKREDDEDHDAEEEQDERERQNNLREQLEFQRTHSMLKQLTSIRHQHHHNNLATTNASSPTTMEVFKSRSSLVNATAEAGVNSMSDTQRSGIMASATTTTATTTRASSCVEFRDADGMTTSSSRAPPPPTTHIAVVQKTTNTSSSSSKNKLGVIPRIPNIPSFAEALKVRTLSSSAGRNEDREHDEDTQNGKKRTSMNHSSPPTAKNEKQEKKGSSLSSHRTATPGSSRAAQRVSLALH